MKAINLLPTDLLVVVTENHLRDFYISGLNFACAYEPVRTVITELPEGNWEILGTCTKDHIDFDVQDLVESIEVAEYKYGGELHPKDLFLDYESKTYWLESYAESFRSLLSSNGLHFVNPLGEKEPNYNAVDYGVEPGSYSRYAKERVEWHQAESNIVQKLLIIKPLK